MSNYHNLLLNLSFRKIAMCGLMLLWAATQSSAAPAPVTITVAAAADLGPALRELSAEFEKQNGARVSLVLGSSGNLTTQIEHGAPYDVFMSADIGYARQLETEGHAVPGSLYRYARGRLVLWALTSSGINVSDGLKALRDTRVKKIAIANPQHAPYGRAARDALRAARLYDELASKLVLGENVAQTAQFVTSGNAQTGLLPLALALAPEMRAVGTYWEVPPALYPPIEQGAVVVRASPAATAFLAFLKTTEAAAILRRYGFEVERATAKAAKGR